MIFSVLNEKIQMATFSSLNSQKVALESNETNKNSACNFIKRKLQ